MKKSKLYTRTGDEGKTSLVGGQRVEKTNVRLEAYGTIDELNSQLGLLATYVTDETDLAVLLDIQRKLFAVGTTLASPPDSIYAKMLKSSDIEQIEQAIDLVDSELPASQNFILPGGTRAAAVCHVCRTVCRRAERRMISVNEQMPIDNSSLIYVNRLSDYLFALARKLNFVAKKQEINSQCV